MANRHFKPRGFSLTFRLSLSFTLLIIILMGFIGFSIFIRDRDTFTKDTINRGWSLVHTTNAIARDALSSKRFNALNEVLTKLKSDGFVMEAAVYDEEGKVVAFGGPGNEFEANTYLNTAYKKPDQEKLVSLKNEDQNIVAFAFASPVSDDTGKIVGYTHIIVDFSKTLRHLQQTGYNLIVIFVIAVLMGLIVARYIVVKAVGKPVEELMKATEKVSLGDFSSRIDVPRNDELGRLAQAFNIMSDQLGVLFNSIKHVVSEMNTTSDLIVHRSENFEKTDPSVQKEFMKEINHGAKRLNRISLQLDSLALQFKTREG
jgi:methyl-accepting chemotaxis protein